MLHCWQKVYNCEYIGKSDVFSDNYGEYCNNVQVIQISDASFSTDFLLSLWTVQYLEHVQ